MSFYLQMFQYSTLLFIVEHFETKPLFNLLGYTVLTAFSMIREYFMISVLFTEWITFQHYQTLGLNLELQDMF